MEWRILKTLQTLELTPTMTERAIIATSNTIDPWVFLIKASGGKSQILIAYSDEDEEVIVPAFSIFKQATLEDTDFIYSPVFSDDIKFAYLLVQKKHAAFPLFNMYRDMYEEIDPLGTIMNAASEMSKRHGTVLVWFGIKGLSDKEERKAKKSIYKVILQMKSRSAKGHNIINTPSEINSNLNLKYSRGEMNIENDIERKRTQTLFNVTIMFGSEKKISSQHVTSVFNMLKHHNQLIPVAVNDKTVEEILEKGAVNNSLFKRRSNILSHVEIASVVHPPSVTASVGSVQHTGFKNLEIPYDLPGDESNMIGYAVGSGNERPLAITKEILERNCIAIGNSGFGKSTVAVKAFIEGLKVDPTGTFIFYDPHGDATKVLLNNIPKDRVDDVVLLDAADMEYPFSYNMMDTTDILSKKKYKKVAGKRFYFDPERFDQLTPIIKQLVDVLRIISMAQLGNSKDSYAFGPRAADIFSEMFGFFMSTVYIGDSLSHLFGHPVFTMGDAIKFLTDDDARKQILQSTVFSNSPANLAHHSKEMMEYWNYTFPNIILGYSRQKSDTLSAATNKIRNAIPPRMLKVSCQVLPYFKIAKFMKPGKIIIMRIPESIGSVEAQTLLSSSLFSDVHFELVRRAETTGERTPTYIFLDEADTISQKLVNLLLNKDRKFGAHLFVNFQNLMQVGEETRDSILTSVNTLFVFRTSGMDGRIMETEFDKTFLSASDFTNTAKHYAYARIPIKGRISAPFVFKTEIVPQGSENTAETIRTKSRKLIARKERSIVISFIDLMFKQITPQEREKSENTVNKKVKIKMQPVQQEPKNKPAEKKHQEFFDRRF